MVLEYARILLTSYQTQLHNYCEVVLDCVIMYVL